MSHVSGFQPIQFLVAALVGLAIGTGVAYAAHTALANLVPLLAHGATAQGNTFFALEITTGLLTATLATAAVYKISKVLQPKKRSLRPVGHLAVPSKYSRFN